MEPVVSVILPVYNNEKYLVACLESVLDQSFHNMEILAVDDGSTDSSGKILDRYHQKDGRLKVWHNKNAGVASARNFAMMHAKGKYLAFCDSDDTVPHDAYQMFVAAAENKDAEVTIGGFCDMDDMNILSNAAHFASSHGTPLSKFDTFFLTPCVWNKLIRLDFIKKHNLRFDESRTIGEDVVFLAEAFVKADEIAYTEKTVYCYWKHTATGAVSLNNRYSYAYFLQHIDCRDQLLKICGEKYAAEAENYIYHVMSRYLLEFFLRVIDKEDCIRVFDALKVHLSQHDWAGNEVVFEAIFGIPPSVFFRLNAFQYTSSNRLLDHKEMVWYQFKTGEIGFYYIIKYMKAWVQYKWRLIKMRYCKKS